MRLIDLTGTRFGRLVVQERAIKAGKVHWCCICDCGAMTTVKSYVLASGRSNSCGCLRRDIMAARRLRHGMSKSSEHKIWTGIHERCENPNSKFYSYYGGRGIKRCKRWDLFENFYADMGPRPSKRHTIDRIDNDGNYEPGNCRWALPTVQQGNTRKNIMITIGGETRHMSEWARRYGIDPDLVSQRIIRDGLDPYTALTKPRRSTS